MAASTAARQWSAPRTAEFGIGVGDTGGGYETVDVLRTVEDDPSYWLVPAGQGERAMTTAVRLRTWHHRPVHSSETLLVTVSGLAGPGLFATYQPTTTREWLTVAVARGLVVLAFAVVVRFVPNVERTLVGRSDVPHVELLAENIDRRQALQEYPHRGCRGQTRLVATGWDGGTRLVVPE